MGGRKIGRKNSQEKSEENITSLKGKFSVMRSIGMEVYVKARYAPTKKSKFIAN